MLYLAGIIITFFLAALLTGKKNKTAADKILIAWLCAMAFHLLLFYLFITDEIYKYPILLGIPLPYPLIHGPFLFLYTAALTRQQSKNKITWVIHFLPAIILTLALLPFFQLTAAEKIAVYRNKGAGYEDLMNISFIAIVISGIAYVIASLVLLRRYKQSIENEFSNTDKINLAWLRYLVHGIAFIWIVVILGDDPMVFGAVVLFVFFLGYFGIRQVGIFSSLSPQNNKLPVSSNGSAPKESVTLTYEEGLAIREINQTVTSAAIPKTKYEKSGLDDEKANKIYQQLVGSMTTQKLFTDFDLTLGTLAKTLEVHPNHLSQVVNSFEGKNFYDYINSQRVEEFKKLAPQPANRNYTLLSLAYECGFNSKTSFNRNFKKATGVSPTEWLQQQEISLIQES